MKSCVRGVRVAFSTIDISRGEGEVEGGGGKLGGVDALPVQRRVEFKGIGKVDFH